MRYRVAILTFGLAIMGLGMQNCSGMSANNSASGSSKSSAGEVQLGGGNYDGGNVFVPLQKTICEPLDPSQSPGTAVTLNRLQSGVVYGKVQFFSGTQVIELPVISLDVERINHPSLEIYRYSGATTDYTFELYPEDASGSTYHFELADLATSNRYAARLACRGL